MPRATRGGFRRLFEENLARLVDPVALHETIARLESDGLLSAAAAAELRRRLPETLEQSAYVLRHLAAHLAIGAIFAFDLIPLPLGTIGRVLWVIGNRVYESLRGDRERARVHSLGVLFIAAIPWLGYAAYLLPLRRASDEAAYLHANHLSYTRSGCAVETLLATKPRVVRRMAAWLVPSLAQADLRC